ncbi:MAG TPA: glycerophosphodiester phosphodiesterase [Vicinamibacterales bacterium]|jgi:glycerophosphoryl diester phosphodiesterase|nr:glycerophosphodiester phosphodiesterase [Vicinamibacterales bacterium]
MVTAKLIAAHRGGRSSATPNTFQAFEHAIGIGADMIELDVRRTSDDELVVFHDEAIGSEPLRTLSCQELQERAGKLGYSIPRFAEVIELASGRILLDIELKESGYEDEVLQLVFDRRLNMSDFVITSFLEEVVAAVEAMSPEVRTGLLVDQGGEMTGLRALEIFSKSGADLLAPHYTLLDEWTLREAEAAGTTLLPWTVNGRDDIERLLAAQAVFGVITDEPELGLRLRAVSGSWPSRAGAHRSDR